jgi:hypothetical protein
LPIFATVGFRQKPEDLDYPGFRGALETPFDLASLLPGFVNLLLQPFEDLVNLTLVLHGVDSYLSGMHRNELPAGLESDRRRLTGVLKASQNGIEIGQDLRNAVI